MSFEKEIGRSTERFHVRRAPRKQSRPHDDLGWIKSYSRSISRSKTPLIVKKIEKREKTDVTNTRKRFPRKKKMVQIKRPSAPHNTNQYLIDVNHPAEEPAQLYGDCDRFSFDFQHHSMAGSMMEDLERLSNMFQRRELQQAAAETTTTAMETEETVETVKEKEEEEEEKKEDSMGNEENPREEKEVFYQEGEGDYLVNSHTMRLETDNNPVNIAAQSEGGNVPSQYNYTLSEDNTKEDLHNVVNNLITLIHQKNQEISTLKSRLAL